MDNAAIGIVNNGAGVVTINAHVAPGIVTLKGLAPIAAPPFGLGLGAVVFAAGLAAPDALSDSEPSDTDLSGYSSFSEFSDIEFD